MKQATLLSLSSLLDGWKPRPPTPNIDPFAMFSWMSLIGPIIGVGVTVLVIVVVLLPILKRSRERDRLMQVGERANAKILGLQDTGTLINNNPQLAIMLEIYPTTGRPPFQAQCVTTVSFLAIPRIQPGMMVPVRFDPNNPASVALEV